MLEIHPAPAQHCCCPRSQEREVEFASHSPRTAATKTQAADRDVDAHALTWSSAAA